MLQELDASKINTFEFWKSLFFGLMSLLLPMYTYALKNAYAGSNLSF